MPKLTWHFLQNKKIGIWGFGKEGTAARKALEAFVQGVEIISFDDNSLNEMQFCDVVVLSPGISIYRPEIIKAKQQGIIFTTGTNLFLDNKPLETQVLAITGTKGKSTTATIVWKLLCQTDKKTALGGNIGKPLIDFLFEKQDIIVAELSSYQCASLVRGVDGALLLNLYPEHLQWHVTHENYYLDKLNLIKLSSKKVLNSANEETLKRVQHIDNVSYFGSLSGWHVTDGFFMRQNQKMLAVNELALPGEHNALNACAALTLLDSVGISLTPNQIKAAFNNIHSLDHRLQKIADINGVSYVDDSISTTPQSTLAALKTFQNHNIILLAGGFDRGQEYAPLIEYIKPLRETITLITLPDTGQRLHQQALQNGIRSLYVHTMEQAVKEAVKEAQSETVVLLSPAAPSYNSYKNFEERGKDFASLVDKYAFKNV